MQSFCFSSDLQLLQDFFSNHTLDVVELHGHDIVSLRSGTFVADKCFGWTVERMQLHHALADHFAPFRGRAVHTLVKVVVDATLFLQQFVTRWRESFRRKQKKKKFLARVFFGATLKEDVFVRTLQFFRESSSGSSRWLVLSHLMCAPRSMRQRLWKTWVFHTGTFFHFLVPMLLQRSRKQSSRSSRHWLLSFPNKHTTTKKKFSFSKK